MNIEEYERLLGSPREFIEEFCYITTKRGKFGKLKLNKPQQKLMDIVEEKIENHEPIRIRVLKARQMGFSTLISALGFWWAAMNENSAYAVVAHKETSASSIFEKNKIFYDNLPSALKPKTNRFNSERISFNVDGATDYDEVRGLRSKIFFGTAGGGELFRGETILFLHKSEVAFWEDKNGVLKKSLNATVPYSPFSVIIEETTANGYNSFKDNWDKSVRGENNYVPLFVGWNELDEYQVTPPEDFELTQKELELQMDYDLTDAQLYWRRITIADDYDGNELWFQQEYPLTPQEAFVASGFSVFDHETIKKGYEFSEKPIRKQAIKTVPIREKLNIWEEPETRDITEYEQLVRWNEEKQDYEYYDGEIVTAEKTVCANYTVGLDTSGLGADMNQIVVWHNTHKRMVARLGIENLKEKMLAKVAVEIARYYNNAMIAPEVNYSHAICDYILDEGYKNIYIAENMKRVDKKKESTEYGWTTSTATKPPLISTLRSLVDERPEAVPDRNFWYETEYYVMENVAKNIMNAVPGHHDDIIMATAIAHYVSNSRQSKQGYTTLKTPKERPKESSINDLMVDELHKKANRKSNKYKRGVFTNHA